MGFPKSHLLELEAKLRDIISVPERTSSEQRPAISVSVREMVEFVLRTGSLGGERDFSAPSRALEGTRGHQRIQKGRPEGYQAEVRVKHDLPRPDFAMPLDMLLLVHKQLLIDALRQFWAVSTCCCQKRRVRW